MKIPHCLFIGLTLVTIGCMGSSDAITTSDPKELLTKYVEAVKQDDVKTLEAFLQRKMHKSWQQLKKTSQENYEKMVKTNYFKGPLESADLTKVELDEKLSNDEKMVVRAPCIVRKKQGFVWVTFVKEEGGWRHKTCMIHEGTVEDYMNKAKKMRARISKDIKEKGEGGKLTMHTFSLEHSSGKKVGPYSIPDTKEETISIGRTKTVVRIEQGKDIYFRSLTTKQTYGPFDFKLNGEIRLGKQVFHIRSISKTTTSLM